MSGTDEAPTTVVMVVADGTEVVVGSLSGCRPDLALVDALLRLQLAARRRGQRVCLRGASEELRAFLRFAGLDGLLALEARRQPELGEELGVQEVVQPRDPSL